MSRHLKWAIGYRGAKAMRCSLRNPARHIRHHNQKFLTTNTRDKIDRSQISLKPARNLCKHRVPSSMAVGIVDVFEKIEISHHNGKRPVHAPSPLCNAPKMWEREATVM
jgi:hypothetical protein